jgi:hypothetical protein
MKFHYYPETDSLAVCRFEWVSKEKWSGPDTLSKAQNCFTTKDTKGSKALFIC